MQIRKSVLFIISGVLSMTTLSAQNFGGNPASVKWYQLNSAGSRVIFPKGLDSQALRISSLISLLGDKTASSIGSSQKKWDVILQNKTTIPNAYVRMAPKMSELNLIAPQDNFSTGSLRWDDNLVIHEDRHIQQFSNFNKGLTKVFSFFLGQEGQLLANGMAVPDYFFEGDAVWQETLVSEQGRGRMPAFYNAYKSLWQQQKKYSWMKLRNGSLINFIPDHYATGYLLTAYGYEKYGKDFWKKVTGDAIRFRGIFYPFNKAIETYSGKPYQQFRQDAIDYFKTKVSESVASAGSSASYLTTTEKNNVKDFSFPYPISTDTVLVSLRQYKRIPGFYLVANGKETLLSVKDQVIDDYFSYRNGNIVYATFQQDARRANRDYSNLKLLNIKTNRQVQLTFKERYFSPDISLDSKEILAVNIDRDGKSVLHRLDATDGKLVAAIPNQNNYFFTQIKYIDENRAVAAVRNEAGKMALVSVDLKTGDTKELIPFSYRLVGYPFVKTDTVYFNMSQQNTDQIFAITLRDNNLYQLTFSNQSVYQPSINANGELLVSAFTADGSRIKKIGLHTSDWKEIKTDSMPKPGSLLFAGYPEKDGADAVLSTFNDTFQIKKQVEVLKISRYKKGLHLFNFHSWRPYVNDPEIGYQLFSDNVLSSLQSALSYYYNRSDKSHSFSADIAYAGWFPVLTAGVESNFNRTVDTAVGKSVTFSTATAKTGFNIPLQFIGGRTNTFLNFGAGYNLEQYFYRGVTKNIFGNNAIQYLSSFINLSHVSQKARQQINPRWAQAISLGYRDAFNFRDSKKFVANAALYFPGIFINHSLVLNGSFQKRDTLPDLFSKTFSYSRGYEALSTRQMYKWGVNYHLPLCYPDWGFGNMLYFLRIRTNIFYDETVARARVSGKLTDIKSRSTGAELYFDSKIWNSLPVSFGVRYTRLLDTDLLNTGVKNRWEILIPLNLIPN